MGKSIIEKIWEEHEIVKDGDLSLLYVDLHLIHEVTSPQAFEGLRLKGRKVRRPDLTFATVDHNIPTDEDRDRKEIEDEISRKQVEYLRRNTREFGIKFFGIDSPYQGIVHVIGPELGLTKPGMVIVCGDSHTSTHGALGALAFGIGTSEVEHVLATQTIWLKKPRTMEIKILGELKPGVTAKDVILGLIWKNGVDGATGHIVEFKGVENFSVEERMTLCNMAVEGGARTAIISPDEKVYKYLEGKPYVNEKYIEKWERMKSDEDAQYDVRREFDISDLEPLCTWGTNPGQVLRIRDGVIPHPSEFQNPKDVERALEYMGLKPGMKITDIKIDRVFIGSCTNSRLSDLISAARIVEGRRVAPHVRAMVVPGSQSVKREAERLGIDKIFKSAGFEWRNSGCSMCLGMNPDILRPGERCISTSNRNFEGRQGRGGRTHLASPLTAAASAIRGYITDPREFL